VRWYIPFISLMWRKRSSEFSSVSLSNPSGSTVAHVIRERVQVLDRVLFGVADPLLLVEAVALLAQPVAEVADDRGRLVADLA